MQRCWLPAILTGASKSEYVNMTQRFQSIVPIHGIMALLDFLSGIVLNVDL